MTSSAMPKHLIRPPGIVRPVGIDLSMPRAMKVASPQSAVPPNSISGSSRSIPQVRPPVMTPQLSQIKIMQAIQQLANTKLSPQQVKNIASLMNNAHNQNNDSNNKQS